MEMIKTGLYRNHKIIVKKENEILLPKNDLEKALEKINVSNKKRDKKDYLKKAGEDHNLERWKRIEQTGYMLLEKKKISEITKNLNLVKSTIESYISIIIYETKIINNPLKFKYEKNSEKSNIIINRIESF